MVVVIEARYRERPGPDASGQPELNQPAVVQVYPQSVTILSTLWAAMQ